jgi:hypothetical protein
LVLADGELETASRRLRDAGREFDGATTSANRALTAAESHVGDAGLAGALDQLAGTSRLLGSELVRSAEDAGTALDRAAAAYRGNESDLARVISGG